MIKAILFDLDDTLADRNKSMRKYARKFIDKYYMNPKEDKYLNMIDHFIELDGKGYKDKHYMYNTLIDEWELDKNLTSRFLIDEWDKNFHKSYVLFENSIKVLEILVKKYKLGLLTNGGSACQRSKINATNISKYFDSIIVSREEGIAKPDKEVYFRLCNRLSIKTHECIFVGDNYNTDIKGAINAGITAIWINNKYEGEIHKEDYGYQISTVNKLHLVLDKYFQ